MRSSHLTAELRLLLRKHPLPRRADADRILKGDLAHGSAVYAEAATKAGPSELWRVFLALELEQGSEIGAAVGRLAADARLSLTQWCFASGRADVGMIAFESVAAENVLALAEGDLVDYLAQVERAHGTDAMIAAADELLASTGSQRVLHLCVQALSAKGDLHGAQIRLGQYGDATSTMAGALRAEDVARMLAASATEDRDDGVDASPQTEPTPVLRSPDATLDAAAASTSAPELGLPTVGEILGEAFRITGFVAEGRITQIYSALREQAPRHCALKILLPSYALDPTVADRFAAATEAAQHLHHPGIVPVWAAGEDRGWLFAATELVFGENLDSYVQRCGALPVRAALRVALLVAQALRYALANGAVHGGLRPSNVYFARDLASPGVEHVRIADFGMADVVQEAMPIDAYTAPERLRGAPASATADVYAVGVLLHHLLAGRRPHATLSGDALRDAIEGGVLDPPAPAEAIGPDLLALLERMLRRDPSQRLPSANDLVSVLTVVASGLAAPEPREGASVPGPTLATPEAPEEETKRRVRSFEVSPRADGGLVGRVLDGRFRVVSSLRSGGMAQLYLATQSAQPEQVAIKVMHRHLAEEPEIVKRFAREARLAQKLDHPNIVRLVHVGDELPYFAMEMLAGEDLSIRIKQRRRFVEAEAVRIGIDVSGALAYAHGMGVIHRDIKPANVMMCVGEPQEQAKLLDFGIAKVVKSAEPVSGLSMYRSALTVTGSLVGTPRYMAPEQGRAQAIDARTDLYALGVVLYELVTGSVPFDGETPLQIIARHVQEDPPPLSRSLLVYPELERLILDLLKKAPEERPGSAAEVRARLLDMLPRLATSPHASTRRFHVPVTRAPTTFPGTPDAPTAGEDDQPTKAKAARPETLSSAHASAKPVAPLRTVPMAAAMMPAPRAPPPAAPPPEQMAPSAQVAAAGARPPAGESTERMNRGEMMARAREHLPRAAPADRAGAHQAPPETARMPAPLAPGDAQAALAAQVARLHRIVIGLAVLVVVLAVVMLVR